MNKSTITFLIIHFLIANFSAKAQNCQYLSAPFFQDFESSDWVVASPTFNLPKIDTCWNRNNSGRIMFKAGPHPTAAATGASVDHTTGTSSGKYMHVTTWPGSISSTEGFLETPPIILTSVTSPQLSFWYHMYGFNIDTLKVLISRDHGQSFNLLFQKVGQQHSSKAAPWTESIIDLPSYAGDTVLLRFAAAQTSLFFNNHSCIDDVSLQEKPICLKPLNVRSIAKTDASVTLDWDSSGTASWWQVHYGPVGTAIGNGITITGNQKPIRITGLQPDSTYSF